MANSGGRRRAPTRRAKPPLLRTVLTLAGMVLAGAAWLFLVRAAIDFGSQAKGGSQSSAWGFAALATVGAVVCLLLVLVLGAGLVSLLGIRREHRPRRSAGRRRSDG